MTQETEDVVGRFYIDHGMIHDRLTGKHVDTAPVEIDEGQFDHSPVTETCALLNELSDRIDVLEGANKQLQIDRVTILALVYGIAPATVAKMCDEQLDKSGALLGMVRETSARAALHQEGIDAK